MVTSLAVTTIQYNNARDICVSLQNSNSRLHIFSTDLLVAFSIGLFARAFQAKIVNVSKEMLAKFNWRMWSSYHTYNTSAFTTMQIIYHNKPFTGQLNWIPFANSFHNFRLTQKLCDTSNRISITTLDDNSDAISCAVISLPRPVY